MSLKMVAGNSEYARAEALAEKQAKALQAAEEQRLDEAAAMERDHKLRLLEMELEDKEMDRWTRQVETRFETVQEKRAAIPKRATPEQRSAFLENLDLLLTSLSRVGEKLKIKN